MPPPPVFVINLPQSVERRRESESGLARLGLAGRVVSACDGAAAVRSLPEAMEAAGSVKPHLGRALMAGEIGCLLSHLAVLERIAQEQLPIACVIEDDCSLGEDFARMLRSLDAARADWDVLLLGHHSARHGPAAGAETCFRSSWRGDGHRIARVAEFPMGGYAYVVTLAGARRLLEYGRPLRMPIDWVIGYSPAVGVRLHAVTPPCVTPHPRTAAGSTIAGREARHEPGPRGSRLRALGGRAWLFARKLGVRPDSYVKRF